MGKVRPSCPGLPAMVMKQHTFLCLGILMIITLSVTSCKTAQAGTANILDTTAPATDCVKGQFKNFFADAMGNLLLQLPNNSIKKINNHGDSVGLFNDVRRFGNLESIDVTNPLKSILFYKDFATIVILDRFLKLRNTIDLRLSGILLPAAVAQSYDNNYWVFDAIENKLKKISDNGNIAFATADFRLLFSEAFVPQVIIDDNTKLYLYDVAYGWMIFDYYGAFLQKVPAPGWTDVQVIANNLCGRTGNDWTAYAYKTFTENKQALPAAVNASSKLYATTTYYIALEQEGICRYKIAGK